MGKLKAGSKKLIDIFWHSGKQLNGDLRMQNGLTDGKIFLIMKIIMKVAQGKFIWAGI